MIKTMLFPNFSTPDLFVELSETFSTPSMSLNDFKPQAFYWFNVTLANDITSEGRNLIHHMEKHLNEF